MYFENEIFCPKCEIGKLKLNGTYKTCYSEYEFRFECQSCYTKSTLFIGDADSENDIRWDKIEEKY